MAGITNDLAKKSVDHLETTRRWYTGGPWTISTGTTLLVHTVKVHIIQKIQAVVRIDKGGLISKTGCQIHDSENLLFILDSARSRDLAPIIRGVSQNEKLSEIT